MRLLASLLTIFSLVTPAVMAVDPTSVPVLIRDCATNRVPTRPPVATAMTRSNHPCWVLDDKAYGSTLVNGNFTLYQYNLDNQIAPTLCDINIARKNNTLKSWTNIPIRSCVAGVGYSFDWAPTERYIGRFGYIDAPGVQKLASTCEDTIQIPINIYFDEALKPDWCSMQRYKYVEMGNNTVQQCYYSATDKVVNASTGQGDCSGERQCDSFGGIYRYQTCSKGTNSDYYYYWMTFGGTSTTPKNDAQFTSHTNIFTIITTLAMAFVAYI